MIDMRRNIDANLVNSDWTKQSWDLPRDVEGFVSTLGMEQDTEHNRRMAVREFVEKKPAANYMPDELRTELVERGYLDGEPERFKENVVPRRVTARTIGKYEGIPEEVTGNLQEATDKGTGERRTFIKVEHEGRNIFVSVDPDSIEPAREDDEDE